MLDESSNKKKGTAIRSLKKAVVQGAQFFFGEIILDVRKIKVVLG